MRVQRMMSTTDVHVAGEAFRIMKQAPAAYFQSLEELYGQFPLLYRDEINLLLNEPRGFAGLKGCLVVPPFKAEADAAIVFFNHEGTEPIQYGGIAAAITELLECGNLPARHSGEYKIETIRGVVPVRAVMEMGEVTSVQLACEPCTVVEKEVPLSLPDCITHYSLVQADRVYAVFEREEFFADIRLEELSELKNWSQTMFNAFGPGSPVEAIILMDSSIGLVEGIRSITFRPDQLIVRSPGYGPTMACYASVFSKSGVSTHTNCVNESIFGSQLSSRLEKENGTEYQFSFTARGFVTGMQTFILDPTDPLASGFLLK
ncbi:proline racemase family protein [Bacillus sp. FJAT-27245]|uniref:proline racemase family protein n=1 Tax=Bacillus sp. FJAT-27245 TaxID=1684144 RepID=UPI0006A7C381|nr:proline racemase family protein [Bacillus sp. FJAT-27245]